MKAKPKLWVFEISWGNSFTEPPAGLPRCLLQVKRVQVGGANVPEEVKQKSIEMGFGTGWALRVYPDPEHEEKMRLARQWSPERKGAMRRRNLRQAAERKAPLFAGDIVARELASNPTYYNPEEPED